MVVIYYFKSGSRDRILETLLNIFDNEEGYETLAGPRGCKGIIVIWNPTINIGMLLCDNIMNLYAKCAYNKTIRNLWVKEEILPPDI